MNLLAELQYLSPLNVFKYSIHATHIFFNIYDVSPKMSFRNRCIIAGSNGLLHLSVPLEGGRDQRLALKDIRIANQVRWQSDHWRTITSAYSRSPFFEFHGELLGYLFQKKFTYLIDWNLALFKWANQALNIAPELHLVDDPAKMTGIENVFDIRNQWKPRNFQDKNGLGSLIYRQVFEERIGFQRNLSIIDLIFCAGNDAKRLLLERPLI
jgi:hypothetical protein